MDGHARRNGRAQKVRFLILLAGLSVSRTRNARAIRRLRGHLEPVALLQSAKLKGLQMITGSRSQYQVSHTRHDVTHTPLSLFRGSYDPTPADTRSLTQVLSAITSDTYAHQITWLRTTLQRHGKGIYDHYKKLLDAVTFGGTFAPTRAKHHLTQPSGLVHLDYDGVHDVAGVKQVLCGGDTVAYSFVSPSGQGLKVGVHVGQVADDGAYKHAWQVVADHFERQYGIIADQSGKDVSRLCFVSWDPEAYVHFDAEVFRVATMITPPPPPIGTRQTPPPGNRREQYLRDAITRAVSLIASSRPPTRNRPGTRHRNRLRAARLLGGYVWQMRCASTLHISTAA